MLVKLHKADDKASRRDSARNYHAKAFCAYVLSNVGVSRQASGVRRARWDAAGYEEESRVQPALVDMYE